LATSNIDSRLSMLISCGHGGEDISQAANGTSRLLGTPTEFLLPTILQTPKMLKSLVPI